ncbi:uncharacterized protein STEHIDRAFT_168004 [Stereum hirsutum FP-91666 SS1]|uniref:uncharacterized protein n=1 Tax=Stereum hirsutum (strain FP-91666) TaxID=721885 RepID=UPI000440F4E4|nr:uncharacterized protein STEHIDRAFT_168004 [Stereum hirsutum FP-91666 SS1]EIM87172.1 hypothetical protein STEHIDRAFT_168004 [Stereum hirsutum FP-91666 SS1]
MPEGPPGATYGQLHQQPVLDPGAPSRRPRRSCWSLCWTIGKISLLLVVLVVALLVTIFVGGLILGIIKDVKDPHREKIFDANGTVASGIVRPLVGKDQKFDVAVSVWIRAGVEEERTWRESLAMHADGEEEKREVEYSILEKPLFSDVVFRDLSVSDKHRRVDVPLRIPTAKFREQNLTLMDLRGSFILIPSSPSPLDRLVNYSRAYNSLDEVPRRSWPFPLGSEEIGDATLADQAIEHFGISTNLLEFHPIPSRCGPTTESSESPFPNGTEPSDPSTTSSEEAKTQETTDSYDDDDEIDIASPTIAPKASATGRPNTNFWTPRNSSHHPFIVTRSQLVVIDETRPFNLTAFNDAYKRMKMSHCSDPFESTYLGPGQKWCQRRYSENGHWDMRMKVTKEDGEGETEWVYPPSLYTAPWAAGPLDLVPVPVNRENCTNMVERNETADSKHWVSLPSDMDDTDEGYVDVTWKISFSSKRPHHISLSSPFAAGSRPDVFAHNQTKYESHKMQDIAELMNGIAGHRFDENRHPIRRLAVDVVNYFLMFVIHVVDIHYWYTRTSAFGISLFGSSIIALSIFLAALVNLIEHIVSDFTNIKALRGTKIIQRAVAYLFTGSLYIFAVLPTVFMTKTVFRLELEWVVLGRTWKELQWVRVKVPVLRRMRESHKERASARLDRRTDWRVMASLYVALAVYFLFYPYSHYILEPSMSPDPTGDELSSMNRFSSALSTPPELVGPLFQFLLNKRTGLFGGRHRMAAILDFARYIITLLKLVKAFTGPYEVVPGFVAQEVLLIGVGAAMAWQALTMKAVDARAGDADEDEE